MGLYWACVKAFSTIGKCETMHCTQLAWSNLSELLVSVKVFTTHSLCVVVEPLSTGRYWLL
jgi:hypothetical protein